MRASVVISTYNQPRALELVLWGYATQSRRDFDIVVADDGSGPGTRRLIERMRIETALTIEHVWHDDAGFRKTEILNRAILAAPGDYLIFTDGDCIPRDDFVATHVELARAGFFLSGGALRLPRELSDSVTVGDVKSGAVHNLEWLRARGWRAGRTRLRLLRSARAASILDLLTPTRASWNGGNASTWRDALIAVNGFDLDMHYGGEDRALGERLEHSGLRGIQIRYRAVSVHLDHERPYVDREASRRNREIRDRIAHGREVRARFGIAELPPDTNRALQPSTAQTDTAPTSGAASTPTEQQGSPES